MTFTKLITTLFALRLFSAFATAGVVVAADHNGDLLNSSKLPSESPIKGYKVAALVMSGTVESISSSPSTDKDTPLVKRNKNYPILCVPVNGQNWKMARVTAINRGIGHLDHIKGITHVGGRSCVRIACFEDAGIWLCNDNHYEISPGNVYLATYARDIRFTCDVTRTWNSALAGGQFFDSDGYNVIVRKDSC